MVEKVSFKVFLKDSMSSGLAKLAKTGNSTFSKLIAHQRNFNRKVIQGTKNVGGLKNSLGGLKSMVLGFVGFQLFSNIFKWGADMEQTRVSFRAMLQDVEKGDELFKQITDYANETPYTNTVLEGGAKTLLAFGVAGNKIMPTLKMLGNIGMGNAEKMRSLTLAYAQTQAAGKLMGQDLLQYVAVGFNPLQIIAQKTGKSMGQLRDEMSKGAISADMVAWAFKTATDEGGMFHGMTEKLSQTIGGKWSTLMGIIQTKIALFISGNNKYFTTILNWMIQFVGFIDKHSSVIGTLLAVLGSAIAGYYAWIVVMKLQMGIMALYKTAMFIQIALTQGWTAAQIALNMAMTLNPIGLVIAAIAALVVGVIWAWNNFEGFRKVVLGVWGVIKGFGKMIKDYVINRIDEFIRGIEGVGNAISLLFQGEFKAAAEAGSKALGNIFVGHESRQKAWEAGKKLGDAYNKGAAKAIRPGETDGEEGAKENGGGFLGFGNAASPDGVASGSIMGGIGGSGGGGSTKNITISVGSLIQGNIEFHTTNITEGFDSLKDKVSEILLQAVNDANLATG